MSRPTSVVIIGAGVAGLSTAMRAAELGAEVTVLERRHMATGSSGLSAGVYSVNQTDPLMIAVRVQGHRIINVLEREEGFHISRIGYLRLGYNDAQLRLFRVAIEAQLALGFDHPSVVLEPDEISRLIPDIRADDLAGGMWNPYDGHLDGALMCSALAERTRRHGGRLAINSGVIELSRGTRHRHAVRTLDAVFEADIVVNAAGPWAASVGQILGHDVALVNQRHEVIRVKQPPSMGYPVPMVQEYVPGGDEGVYFRQDAPDAMLAGFHSHSVLGRLASEDPDNYSGGVAWETVEQVATRVNARLPVEGLGFREGWCGLYPMSVDGQYIVGPHRSDSTVLTVGGFGGAGLSSSLALGAAAAEWALRGAPQTVGTIDHLAPDRASLHQALVDHSPANFAIPETEGVPHD